MERLDDLEAFMAIVEKGSQAAASRHLRRPLQSLNRSLIALERAVGVELIKRTTRRSEPTEAGRIFYERIKPAIAEIIEARNEAANIRGEVSGSLKVGAPVLFASCYVAPIIARFLKLYPNVEIELKASDEQVDLLADGLDIAVRIGASADEVPDSATAVRAARRNVRGSVLLRPVWHPEASERAGKPSLRPAGRRRRGRQMAVSHWRKTADGQGGWPLSLEQRSGHPRCRQRRPGPCSTAALANQGACGAGHTRDRTAGIRDRGNAYPACLATDAGAAGAHAALRRLSDERPQDRSDLEPRF